MEDISRKRETDFDIRRNDLLDEGSTQMGSVTEEKHRLIYFFGISISFVFSSRFLFNRTKWIHLKHYRQRVVLFTVIAACLLPSSEHRSQMSLFIRDSLNISCLEVCFGKKITCSTRCGLSLCSFDDISFHS